MTILCLLTRIKLPSLIVAHRNCAAILVEVYCPQIKPALSSIPVTLPRYKVAILMRPVLCIPGINHTRKKVNFSYVFLSGCVQNYDMSITVMLSYLYNLVSATVRECFKKDVLLGTINNPLKPTENCIEKDISEDGSGSGLACLCTTDLCNFLPEDASIAPKPDEKFENKKLEVKKTQVKSPQQPSIRIKDSEQGKLEEIEIASWS